MSYSGDEQSVAVESLSAFNTSDIFEIRPPDVPLAATPIFDEDLGAVIGYQIEHSGTSTYFDLDGKWVGMDEKGLESPMLDPIDLLFLVGGLVMLLRKGASRGLVAAAGARTASRGLSKAISLTLQRGFLRLSNRPLRFTATTAARMATPARGVPAHILRLAVKHGTKSADPQGVSRAIQCTVKMLRNGKEYTLKVVVRSSDNTVLHFHYF